MSNSNPPLPVRSTLLSTEEPTVPAASSHPGDFHEATKLLQLVMDNIPQSIFWKDRNSVYLGCNQNFARAAGVRCPEAIVGKTDYELAWRKEEAEFFRVVDRRVMDSAQPEYHIIEPQHQADGKQAWLDTNKIPLFDDEGKVVGILGTYEDITERKRAAEALQHAQKMESLGRLAGGIAHDFNNLLGGIIGAAELMHGRLGPQHELADLAAEVLKTAERAAELTGKLLAFSRRSRMQNEVCDIHGAIRNIATLLERSIDRRIHLELRLDAELSTVSCDISEIEASLLNLGLNARDAMPHGGVLRFSTRNVEIDEETCECGPFSLRPGSHLRITVEDTGSGIPENIRGRVFEPFFTTKAQGEGTGLGLSAVYGAVSSHAGAVTFTSRVGEGTSFHVDLPVSEDPVSTRTFEVPLHFPRGGTVLLIDDEEVIRRSTGQLLASLGFQVLTAADGQEGIERFRAHASDVDVIIMDVIMPRLAGGECYELIRKLDEAVPIIMSSGFTRDEFIEDLTRRGASGFLKKPYGRHALSRELARALGERVSAIHGRLDRGLEPRP